MHAFSNKATMAGIALAIVVSSLTSMPASAQEVGSSAMANLVIQVQELQDELRTLRGMYEEQARELENLKRRQRDQYLDLDQRISDVRSSQPVSTRPPTELAACSQPVSTRPPTELAADTTVPPTVSPSSPDLPDVRDPIESQSVTTGIADPQVQSQSAPVTEADVKAAYDQAFQALKELRYADAAEDFQSFLDQYPTSDYADNAQYWLGESYYVTRNYEIALSSFQQLLDNFPDSPKAPDALLKIGYTHYELEQWDSARAALIQVQENYPDTTLSRLAENRLRSMRMEGHY